jgi:hypothetical protein
MSEFKPTRIERPEPVARADAMLSVAFERRDPARMREFLEDFGLLHAHQIDATTYYRGYGPAPYLVSVTAGERDAFIGFSLAARSAEDLQRLARASDTAIERVAEPGGGARVRLIDPAGMRVDVLHGFEPVAPKSMPKQTPAMNTPLEKRRLNQGVRSVTAPSHVYRLGHVVLQRDDFESAVSWYMRHVGIIPSDVQCLPDGKPALGFFRLNRGAEPADHHSVAILRGPASRMLHVSFETMDLEAVGQGHQHLRARGWTPYWGIGRHVLGSQIFDYWKDPVGDEWEHYADGDVMNADFPTGYSPLTRGSLWAWGDDLPDEFRPDVPPEAIEKIYADGGFGGMKLEDVKGLMQALAIPPRPWLR